MFKVVFLLIFISIVPASFAKDIIKISPDVYLKKTDFSELDGWENENYKEAINAFLSSCERILKLPKNTSIFPQVNKKINNKFRR